MAKKLKIETALQNYVNDAFGKIRGLLIGGEAWLVAVDVCNALEIKNSRDAVSRLKANEKMTVDISDGHSGKRGGAQKLSLVNEPGLYRLIFTSRKPEAEKFQDWVYHDVLPSIRKTGSYTLDKDLKELIEARLDGKKMRRVETDNIQHFIEYARAQGYTWEESKFYSRISVICNLGVGLPHKNGRNTTTKEQLRTLALLEGSTIPAVLIDNMANGTHWTQILARVQQQINLCIDAIFPKPLLTSTEVTIN